MSYSEYIFNDKNPIKRWLQRRRLVDAAKLAPGDRNTQVVLDFGAGNGELCKLLARQYPHARLLCYEPSPDFMAEARSNLRGYRRVEFFTNFHGIPQEGVDLLFCLEVFEHLPATETGDALEQIHRLLHDEGVVVVGVPIEVGIPALYKGLFRMVRHSGGYDARLKNVLLAACGVPPKNRPRSEIAPGFAFYYEHTGFDYRRFREVVSERFHLQRIRACPFSAVGTWFNPEVYFILRKK